MAGESFVVQSSNNSNLTSKKAKESVTKKKKKTKRGGTKKKMTAEQALAFKSVSEWVFLEHSNSSSSSSSSSSSFVVDDFGIQKCLSRVRESLVFELHSHSKCSDGFLSPSNLVERAHGNGVKVLALTDHDTMAGVAEALEAARRFGMKIIPGVEISSIFSPRGDSDSDEPVHVLAYYSSCGPSRLDEVEKVLSNIRDGRFLRAKSMVEKLNKLKLPIKWEQVTRIAGKGVAPGRLHVARAMVESGHVENLKQAFSRYLFDGGPAYSTGNEPLAEEAVKLICDTGGVAVLAHPWALKNPAAVVRRLKEAGLHGMEVFRSDGRLSVFNDLADTYDLLKVGGSDYHGKGGHSEYELGSVKLPVLALRDFLKVARPIWYGAIRNIVEAYAKDPSDSNLACIANFGKNPISKGGLSLSSNKVFIDRCLSSSLTNDEMHSPEFEAIRLKLSQISINQESGIQVAIESK